MIVQRHENPKLIVKFKALLFFNFKKKDKFKKIKSQLNHLFSRHKMNKLVQNFF